MVGSAVRGASALTKGGEGRGHIVAAARIQLVLLSISTMLCCLAVSCQTNSMRVCVCVCVCLRDIQWTLCVRILKFEYPACTAADAVTRISLQPCRLENEAT